MALLITYSKSEDFVDGKVSLGVLHQEILDSSSVSGLIRLALEGDSVELYGDSIVNQTTLDGVIAAHDHQYIYTGSTANTFTISTVSQDIVVLGKTITHPTSDFNVLSMMKQCEAMYSEQIQTLVDDSLATVKINGVVKAVFHPMRTL